MKPLTYHEQVAAQCGYPAGLFGYSPGEREYWHEDLPWLARLHNPQYYGLDPAQAAQELDQLHGIFVTWNENMAPRFRAGSALAGKPVEVGAALSPGDVLIWWGPGEAADCFEIARVVKQETSFLRLAYDNGGYARKLAWVPGTVLSERPVYRVTHYSTTPYLSL